MEFYLFFLPGSLIKKIRTYVMPVLKGLVVAGGIKINDVLVIKPCLNYRSQKAEEGNERDSRLDKQEKQKRCPYFSS